MNMGGTSSTCFFFFPAAALCFLFFVQIFRFDEAKANPNQCANSDIRVYAEIKEDIPFICRAAENTCSFLTKAGLDSRVPIEVHVVENLKELPCANRYYGMYEKRHKRVTVLSYSSCRKQYRDSDFCGLRLCRKLHSSFIVHEIAHAIAHANLDAKAHSIAAEEYIAYTTQLALLPDEIRQKILLRIDNEGFGHEREITSLFYQLNPSVFAVKAYRHFLRPENGKRFYHKLITGQCILDRSD